MKKVILNANKDEIALEYIAPGQPIFAKEKGKLVGMLVKEDKGWIVRIGGGTTCAGHYADREKCLERAEELGFEFFCEED